MGNHPQPITAFPIKRAFLYTLVVSVIVVALMGVVTILMGNFGWFGMKAMLTGGAIALSSLCGLACGAYLGTGRAAAKGALPITGMVLTAIALLTFLFGVWFEPPGKSSFTLFLQVVPSASIFAIACAHLSLLSMARLANWFKWSLWLAQVVIFGVATTIVAIIWFGPPNHVAPFYLLAIAAIIDAAITLLIPLFHKLSQVDAADVEVVSHSSQPPAKHAVIDAEIASLQQRINALNEMKTDNSS